MYKSLRYSIRKILKESFETDDSIIKNRKVYVLIGPPAIGKSTYIKNNLKNTIVISRDEIVNHVAKQFHLSYDELFQNPLPTDMEGSIIPGKEKYGKVVVNSNQRMKEFFPLAFENILLINEKVNSQLSQKIDAAIQSDKDIVIDMTNMDKKGRHLNLGSINNHPEFYKIAIVFNFQSPDIINLLTKIADKRNQEIKKQGGSKTISVDVLKNIIGSYEEPSLAEGFDKIIHVDTMEQLKSALKN